MPGPIHPDRSLTSAKMALDGLALRQELIGRNIANIDTPGYKALTVDFESALQRSIKSLDPIQLKTTTGFHLTSRIRSQIFEVKPQKGGIERADGNNVDIDAELASMAETGIRYEALSKSIDDKLKLIRTIATGR